MFKYNAENFILGIIIGFFVAALLIGFSNKELKELSQQKEKIAKLDTYQECFNIIKGLKEKETNNCYLASVMSEGIVKEEKIDCLKLKDYYFETIKYNSLSSYNENKEFLNGLK